MWQHLSSSPTNLRESPSEVDWKQIEHCFNTKWNFPNCIGALDRKHIMMHCPLIYIHCSTTIKDFFYCFDGPGRCRLSVHFHRCWQLQIQWDSGVFKNSALGEAFAAQMLGVPPPKRLPGYPEVGALPHYIVAHKAFTLRMNLMRPYLRGKKRRTGFPIINPFLTTTSEGPGGLWKMCLES